MNKLQSILLYTALFPVFFLMGADFKETQFQDTLRLAEKGDVQAQIYLGVMYAEGEGTEKDLGKAIIWLRKAADQGNQDAQYVMGLAYANGEGINKDLVEATKWWRKAAEQGNQDAQYVMGLAYANGEGINKDLVEATKWWRKAADQGNQNAQYFLGRAYWYGTGASKDQAEATKWLRKAAEQGYAQAQCFLAIAYDTLEGTEKDPIEIVKWYRKAADQGVAPAQYNLATKYLKGEGVPKDPAEAVRWSRKAAEQDYATAQFFMGRAYYFGEGVIKDTLESLAWYYIAQSNGYDAQQQMAILEQVNGPEVTRLAQQRAKELKTEIELKRSTSGTDGQKSTTVFSANNKIKVTGTGTFISKDGLILTAAHVIQNAKRIQVVTRDGVVSANLLSEDPHNDIAILKAVRDGFCVPIKSSKGVKLGAKVFTLGFPNPSMQGWNVKMTEGSISSMGGLQDDPRQWQISVPLQPGNSGGPLFDEDGNLVGVVVAKLDAIKAAKYTGDLPQNVNYAVKSSYVLPMLEPHESKLLTENKPGFFSKIDNVVEKVQDSVVLILVY